MTFDYDLFVIGAGSGGLAAAKAAASFGASVGIAEHEALGGTCVNRGCIPKKLIVYAADFALQNQMAHQYGWSQCDNYFDWTRFTKLVDKHLDNLNDSFSKQLQKAGVDLIKGYATFIDDHTLEVDNRKITADKILIAVGGRPNLPDIPGIEFAITSREMFHLPYLPKRFVVIGGGYIGIEFASMMNAFGCKVTVINNDELILSGFDDDVRAHIQQSLTKRGIRFFHNSTAKEIKLCEDGLLVKIKADKQATVAADTILVATGRTPNIEKLGLEKVGIELAEKGTIKVNEYNNTNIENIYAVGDCSSSLQLTPVAKAEGEAFAKTVFGKTPKTVNYNEVPTAVFSRPEGASYGMTEQQARSEFGDDVESFKTEFKSLLSQFGGSDEKTLIKIIVKTENQQVLGAHMVGEHAADIIQSLGVAIRKGITKQDLVESIGIHPTTAEELMTL
ncbi:pyridine nucleotide-disulphide oxidoreductase dimerisation region [Rivularia sp. IAM M-261]|nr:pyridine nucleotide-disulphide oxidoreductase dimerisation region [Calothrix sp. PCC 7716]GJD18004.1 pyridine nucleotide-disulphide oxidoreductase dimerisation region [Rivularia sp. IAM M-261]